MSSILVTSTRKTRVAMFRPFDPAVEVSKARYALGCLLILAGAGCGNVPGDADQAGQVETVESALTSGPTKINAGGPAASPWVADVDFSGGSTVTRTNAIDLSAVDNPAPTALYQSQRNGNFTYTLPGFTNGQYYQIRLHFCDTHWTAAGSRTFNVSINGTQVLSSFDIIKTVGAGNKALTQSFTMPASSSGQFVIQFTTVKDAAMVSGIEVATFKDSAYAAQCAAAGVPFPPPWGSLNAGLPGAGKAWTYSGRSTGSFIDFPDSEIYWAATTSPAGLCLINGHGDFSDAQEFDVICQGTNGKACFWAGTQLPAGGSNGNPPVHNTSILGASWTSSGGVTIQDGFSIGSCTNCHAGQNAFIAHNATGAALNLLGVAPNWMPTTWYSPVGAAYPLAQNEGPDPLADFPPSTSSPACTSCHTKGGPPGPFPRLSGALGNEGAYCGILEQVASLPSSQGGMPPGNTCSLGDPNNPCAIDNDPFVMAIRDQCHGADDSHANSPVALSGTATGSPYMGTWDHVVMDKWVDGYRQVWQLDDHYASGSYGSGWSGTDQTNDLMSNYRSAGFFRNGSASDPIWAANDQTGTIYQEPDNALVTDGFGSTPAVGAPGGYVRHDGLNTIVFRSTDGNIHETFWDGLEWSLNPPLPAGSTALGDPMGYRRSSQSSSIIFGCNGGEICEHRLAAGAWHTRTLSPAAHMALFVPTPLATSDGKFVIFYIGTDGLRQIVDTCDPDPTFSCKPTESLVYASTNIVSAPAPYVDQSGGVSVAVVTDSNGANSSQVVQISRAKNGSTWTATTLYTAAKSTETLVGDPAAYLAAGPKANTIIFRNSAFKTYELQWSASQSKYVLSTITF